MLRVGGGPQRLGESGFPVGMLPGVEYEQHEFPFAPGDRLYVYSDGVTECTSDAREAFGLPRLEKVLSENAGRSVSETVGAIERRLRQWRSADDFADDVTLLGIERRAA